MRCKNIMCGAVVMGNHNKCPNCDGDPRQPAVDDEGKPITTPHNLKGVWKKILQDDKKPVGRW